MKPAGREVSDLEKNSDVRFFEVYTQRLAQLLRTHGHGHGALAGSPSTGVRCLEGVKEVVINAVTCKACMRAFGAHESTIRYATSLSEQLHIAPRLPSARRN